MRRVGLLLFVDAPAQAGVWNNVQVGIFASQTGPRVLWQTQVTRVVVRGPGPVTVVLSEAPPAHLFAEGPRWGAILRPDTQRWSRRVGIDGGVWVAAAALGALSKRVAALEAAWRPEQVEQAFELVGAAVDDHELRLGAIEAASGLAQLHEQLAALVARVDRLDCEDGRMMRLEDELEDLVGPDGDVVDLEERLTALESVEGGAGETAHTVST